MKSKILYFNEKGDERGRLVAIEGKKDIPFTIQRVFYIFGSDPAVVRGLHANRKTEFVLINVSGTSKIKVDNGTEQTVIELNQPHVGVYLPRMLWKEMYDFSLDSVLLVLASEHYDLKEYIRDYQVYLQEMQDFTKESVF